MHKSHSGTERAVLLGTPCVRGVLVEGTNRCGDMCAHGIVYAKGAGFFNLI